MDKELPAAALQKLIGVNEVSLADLAKRGIAVRGEKRGCYAIESVPLSLFAVFCSRVGRASPRAKHQAQRLARQHRERLEREHYGVPRQQHLPQRDRQPAHVGIGDQPDLLAGQP
jgi:hypothetical protein